MRIRIIIQVGIAVLLGAASSVAQTFADVPSSSVYYTAAEGFWSRGITAGNGFDGATGKLTFGPTTVITRGEAAAFVIRSIYSAVTGDAENFTLNQATPYFTDVLTSHPQFRYIQKMWELGITDGCNTAQYCPGDQITNGQLAKFAMRAQMSRDGAPQNGGSPANVAGSSPSCIRSSGDCVGVPQHFADVPSTYLFHDWIEALYYRIGTQGALNCSSGNYCPDDSAFRGQTAVDLLNLVLTGASVHVDTHPTYSVISPANNSTLTYGSNNSVQFTVTGNNVNWSTVVLALSYQTWKVSEIGLFYLCPNGGCGSQATVTVSGLATNSDGSHPYIYAWLYEGAYSQFPDRIGVPTRYTPPTGSGGGTSTAFKDYIRLGSRVIAIETVAGGPGPRNPPGTVTAPTFNPAGGSYTGTQTVTMSTSTTGASINYTTDGSNPTASTGILYTEAIAVSSSTTLKAIAYEPGWTDSQVSSAAYTIVPNAPPTVVSISPSSGSGASQQFTATFQDPNGGANIQGAIAIFNSSLSYSGGCAVQYTNAARSSYFQLFDDSGSTLLGTVYPGSGSVSNSQCTLSGAGSSVSISGNNLTLIVNLTFSQSNFTGPKNSYLYAWNSNAGASGYTTAGSWTVPPPSLGVSISPAGPIYLFNNATQQFTATVTGASNTAVTWSMNPTWGTLSTSGLYRAPVAVSSPTWIYITATSQQDPTKFATASVYVQQAPMPTLNWASPTYGSAARQTFTYSVTDASASMYWVQPDFSTGDPAAANGCHMLYYPATNTLYLDSSAGGSTWVGSTSLGGGNLSNGYCTVHAATSSWAQNGTTYNLSVDVEFLAPAQNTYKNMWMSAANTNYQSNGSFAGPQYFGYWYVPNISGGGR
jgi:hypothetical protein